MTDALGVEYLPWEDPVAHERSIRQGAKEVWSFELLPKPPEDRAT